MTGMTADDGSEGMNEMKKRTVRFRRARHAAIAGTCALVLLLVSSVASGTWRGWADKYTVALSTAFKANAQEYQNTKVVFNGTGSWVNIGGQNQSTGYNARTQVGFHHAHRGYPATHRVIHATWLWRWRYQSSGFHRSWGDQCNADLVDPFNTNFVWDNPNPGCINCAKAYFTDNDGWGPNYDGYHTNHLVMDHSNVYNGTNGGTNGVYDPNGQSWEYITHTKTQVDYPNGAIGEGYSCFSIKWYDDVP